ncbi:C-terminal helicase domain-containing protein [Clostridium aromativorans]|uniref:C-terminal helicase domain-containing protein n=1 Tax=Clostridium aromativorans TaxID=2836848 RepID=UPI001E55BD07|nr:C-terminal helicase domain-containing protein [Clostridium aromativorans]
MPSKRRVVQTIDFDTGKYSELIQDAVEKAKTIDTVKKYFDKGRLTREAVNEGRQAIGIAKAPYVAAFVKMLLDAGEDETNILIILLRAGSGLNLQKATCVVFGEFDWSPAVHSQCEDRAHRIGKKDSLLCYYLVAPEGTDEEIQEHLGLKVSQFVGIMGDKAETEEDRNIAQNVAAEHMNKIIEKLKNMKFSA